MEYTEPSLPGPLVLTRGARRLAARTAAENRQESSPVYIEAFAAYTLADLAADALNAQGGANTVYWSRRHAVRRAIELGVLGAAFEDERK